MPKDQQYGPVRIDENRLDQEWLAQPRLVRQYGEAEAEARYKYNRAKAALELIRSEVYLEVCKNPAAFGLDEKKPTVGMIEAVVTKEHRYRLALRLLHKAEKEQDEAVVDMKSLEHKKRALENLVILHGRDYRSEPRVPDDQLSGVAVHDANERIRDLRRRNNQTVLKRKASEPSQH